MIRIEKEEIYGFEAAIRGMRNSFNSWDKSDSLFFDQWSGEAHDICWNSSPYDSDRVSDDYSIGMNDIELMRRLAKAGSSHAKFRRMVMVSIDITAPLYFWKEFDTYKVGTVANSCSTMHKIADKEFELDDFSYEHLISEFEYSTDEGANTVSLEYLDKYCLLDAGAANGFESPNYAGEIMPIDILELTVAMLNRARELYLKTKDKRYWWQMIQLLPSSYNQKRTVMLNYEVLSHIYSDRKDHKLDEWRDFCKWIETLPFAEGIIFPMFGETIEKVPEDIVNARFKSEGQKEDNR